MSTAEDERYIPGAEIVSRVVDSVRRHLTRRAAAPLE